MLLVPKDHRVQGQKVRDQTALQLVIKWTKSRRKTSCWKVNEDLHLCQCLCGISEEWRSDYAECTIWYAKYPSNTQRTHQFTSQSNSEFFTIWHDFIIWLYQAWFSFMFQFLSRKGIHVLTQNGNDFPDMKHFALSCGFSACKHWLVKVNREIRTKKRVKESVNYDCCIRNLKFCLTLFFFRF